jgi:hypothetical protein
VPHPLRGATGYLGGKRLEQSRLEGLTGEIRALAVYPSVKLGMEQHNGVHNAFAQAVGCARREPAGEPPAKPVVRLDPADGAAFERDFALPADDECGVEATTADGRQVLRIKGDASAGMDLDENDRARGDKVQVAFRFRIESGDPHVLCTVGDANQPARVVARGGEVSLTAGDQNVSCGKMAPNEWHLVEIMTTGDQTAAKLDGGPEAAVRHRPAATWLYLGEGYRGGSVPATNRFLIDIASVRSKVERAVK